MRFLLPVLLVLLASCGSPEEPETARNNSGLIFNKVPPKPEPATHSPADDFPSTPTPTPHAREMHPAYDHRDSPFGYH